MLGAELPRPLTLSYFTSAMLKTCVAFCQKANPSAHFSLGEPQVSSQLHQLPHLMFPLMKVMDRVIVTEPGGLIPVLGREIEESKLSQQERKASKQKFKFQLG